MRIIFTIILAFSVTALVLAVPPPPPARTYLIKRSDIVAIVSITNVTDHVSTEAAWKQGRRQSAFAVVDRALKGTPPRVIRLTFEGQPLSVSCQAPSLSRGQFLVFLRRQGDGYVRTDSWYGQATINTNHAVFPQEYPIPLETVVREIERTERGRR